MLTSPLIVVRGAGDIATGTICRLYRCGFKILALEVAAPSAIRRGASLGEAIYDGDKIVEGVTAVLAESMAGCEKIWKEEGVPLVIDPFCNYLEKLAPFAVVDSILAKKNHGMSKDMAPVTIGLGPGFQAGKDVHAVVETARGHDLGRIIYAGSATANSGIPGDIGGYARERVIYSPASGQLKIVKDIGCLVEAGDVVAHIGNESVVAVIPGLVRGMIRDGYNVTKGMKIADIDPRKDQHSNCHTISDKARCISGGVLEAILFLSRKSHG